MAVVIYLYLPCARVDAFAQVLLHEFPGAREAIAGAVDEVVVAKGFGGILMGVAGDIGVDFDFEVRGEVRFDFLVSAWYLR